MTSRVRIVENNNVIKSRLLFTLRKIADRAFSKAAPIIETKARLVLARTISESPVIDSLLNGFPPLVAL
jgi:hypothetical protein